MKQCENCQIYKKWYDDMHRSGDDCLVVGEESQDKHYCLMYSVENGIPQSILDDSEKCEHQLTIQEKLH